MAKFKKKRARNEVAPAQGDGGTSEQLREASGALQNTTSSASKARVRAASNGDSLSSTATPHNSIGPSSIQVAPPSAATRSLQTTSHFAALSSAQAITGAVESGQQLWRKHAVEMAKSLLLVLRSAGISTVFAWLVVLCFSRGNIFSGQAPEQQTMRMFESATFLWSKLFSWFGVAATHAIALTAQRFASKPDVKPTFVACWRKVLRGTSRFVCASTVVTIISLVALLRLPDSVRAFRFHFYFNATWFHFDTVACGIEATRIFEDETMRGQEKQRASPRRRRLTYWKQLLRTFAATLFTNMSSTVAAVYAHVTSYIALDTPASMLIFTFSSFALKVVLQEFAKYCVFKRKVQSVTSIAVTVGVPTILIDTQTRIVLLLASTTSATLSGTLAMALIEIAMRCFKSFYVKQQIKRELARRQALAKASTASSLQVRVTSVATRLAPTSIVPASVGSAATDPAASISSVAAQQEDFDKWRQRLVHYHATEVYIDVFAEYVALGCSYAILFVYWNHPKYMLSRFHGAVAATTGLDSRRGSSSDDNDSDSPSLSSIVGSSQAIVLAIQLSAEIVVDYASCLLEISNGIDFRPLQRQSFFLSLLLMWAATGNISISSNIYLVE